MRTILITALAVLIHCLAYADGKVIGWPASGGGDETFYLSCNTVDVTTPDTGSTMGANSNWTSTTGETGNAYEVESGTDAYFAINLDDIDMGIGTIDMYYRPDYSGTPTANQYLFYSNAAFYVNHNPNDGGVTFAYGTLSINHVTWSPTSGTWYHIVARWDNTTGAFSLTIDSTEVTDSGVQTEPAPTYLWFGRQWKSDQEYAIDEVYIYDEVID